MSGRGPGPRCAIILLLLLVPGHVQAGAVGPASGVARICRLVERTPWGFEALERPPSLEGFTTIQEPALDADQRVWAFGCAGARTVGARAA